MMILNTRYSQYGKFLVLLLSLLVMVACQQDAKKKAADDVDVKTLVVAPKTLTSKLYFSGTLKPLSLINVPSPEEGIVVEKHFEYGQPVKKDQLLIKLNSEKLETDFNAALTAFLTAKDKLNTSRIEFEGTKALSKLGEVKGDEYRTSQSALNNANVAYIQALYKLENAARLSPANVEKLKELTIADISEISKALTTKYNFLDIFASADGIALLAPKSGGSGDDEGKMVVGSSVKQNQILLSIGNLNGLSATININEIDINRIRPGQEVVITGDAFPKIKLKGYIKQIASQAQSTQGASGSLPIFIGTIVVPKLSDDQRKVIRVGMSAKIQLIIKYPDILQIPIDAVYQKKGRSWVKKKVNGKVIEVPITTGETSFNDVEVTSGLKAGDTIIYQTGDVVVIHD